MWIVALVLTLVTVEGPTVSLEMLDGAKLSGKLVGLSFGGTAADEVTIVTAAGRKTLPISDLVKLLPGDPLAKSATTDLHKGRPAVWLELVDGSKIVGSRFTVKGRIARLELHDPSGPGIGYVQSVIEIPTRQIAAVRLQPESEQTTEQWKRIRAQRAEDFDTTSDLLVSRKGDMLDYHRGIVADISEKVLEFNLDGDVLPIRRGKVFAVIYHHPGGQSLSRTSCYLAAVDGSLWAVSSVELSGRTLSFDTPSGLSVSLPLAAVESLDLSRGKIAYLDELTPRSADWTPYFGLPKESQARRSLFGPLADRDIQGEPMRLGGKEFTRGISLRSRSEMVYSLPDDFRRFQAAVGIDDSVPPRGHVRLLIRGDDRILLDTTISGSDKPRQLDLDLNGVRTLTIVVDFGEGLDMGDHLNLGNARVVK